MKQRLVMLVAALVLASGLVLAQDGKPNPHEQCDMDYAARMDEADKIYNDCMAAGGGWYACSHAYVGWVAIAVAEHAACHLYYS